MRSTWTPWTMPHWLTSSAPRRRAACWARMRCATGWTCLGGRCGWWCSSVYRGRGRTYCIVSGGRTCITAPNPGIWGCMRISPHSLAFTLLLGALAGLPALSIDMGLPSLPLVAAEFGASSTEVALTLSLFMLGFGTAQLVIGPLSDHVGRRPVLLAALALYTLAALGSALAPSRPA